MNKNIILYFLFCLIGFSIQARELDLTIYTHTDTIYAKLKVVDKTYLSSDDFYSLSTKLFSHSADGEKTVYGPEDILGFSFIVGGEECIFESCFGKVRKGQIRNRHYFLRLNQDFKVGDVKFFSYYEKRKHSVTDRIEWREVDIIKLRDGRLVLGDSKEFKRIMESYYRFLRNG